MADRYTIDTTRFIPPNLRGIASTLGLDDASNMNAVVSMFMRSRDAAARYSQPEKYSPTGKRETSDLIEAGMGPAEALLGVGLGRFLSEPIRRTLMSMLGIDSGDASKFSTTDRSVPKTDFEAMYGGDRGSLDAASMTDSELLDMFNREYPDTAERFLTDLDSQSLDEVFGPQYLDEVSRAGEGASIDDLRNVNAGPYDPEYVADGGFQADAQARDEAALNALIENDQEATLAAMRPQGRLPDDDPETLARYGYTMGDDGVAVPPRLTSILLRRLLLRLVTMLALLMILILASRFLTAMTAWGSLVTTRRL